MHKHDLLQATIARQATPRTPIALWRHWPVEDRSAEALARATLEFQQRFDFDFIKVTPSQTFVAEDLGLTGVYDGNPEGDLVKGPPPISSLEQWEALRPWPVSQGALGRQLRCLELIAAGAGDTPFIQTIFNPLTVARCLAGARAVIWRRRHPDVFRRGFEAIIETWSAFVAAVMRTGAAGIFLSTTDASYSAMSEEEYRRWGRPGDLEVAAPSRDGWLNVLHLHGEELMFDLVADYPFQVVNWHDRKAGPSLREGAARFSGAVAGGLAQWDTLLAATPEEVAREAREAIAQVEGRGLILAAGCVTPITVPESNIRAAIAVARGSG
ncbi:MAG: uroporphyrinogen decarboxylase family protein [Oscillochloridaceae bacterium]|nr:uroporphyrinogen decarboxylase [Chloroflexaceae bacterium]MDW8388868.1 uroporphyrinogen decarboxylase family protein [Oscillochloridaceae bacterium]